MTTLDHLVQFHKDLALPERPVTPERLTKALSFARGFVNPHDRSRALAALAENLPPDQARAILDDIPVANDWSDAVLTLAERDPFSAIIPGEFWKNPPEISHVVDMPHGMACKTDENDIPIPFRDKTLSCRLERKNGRMTWSRPDREGERTLVFLGVRTAAEPLLSWFGRQPPTPLLLLLLDILQQEDALIRARRLISLARTLTREENPRHCVRTSLLNVAEVQALSAAETDKRQAVLEEIGRLLLWEEASSEPQEASAPVETALTRYDGFWGRFAIVCGDDEGAYTALDARTLLARLPTSLQGIFKEVHFAAEVEAVPDLLTISLRESVDVLPEGRERWRAWINTALLRNLELRSRLLAVLDG